jgi:hypothetical protein
MKGIVAPSLESAETTSTERELIPGCFLVNQAKKKGGRGVDGEGVLVVIKRGHHVQGRGGNQVEKWKLRVQRLLTSKSRPKLNP